MLQLVLLIDSREQYSNVGRNKVESLAGHVQVVRSQYPHVDVRKLDQGDVMWIAKSRYIKHPAGQPVLLPVHGATHGCAMLSCMIVEYCQMPSIHASQA